MIPESVPLGKCLLLRDIAVRNLVSFSLGISRLPAASNIMSCISLPTVVAKFKCSLVSDSLQARLMMHLTFLGAFLGAWCPE